MVGKAVEELRVRDRISEVPLEIKQHILSLLELKDILLTSLLSHNWRYTWLTLPFLDLGHISFDQYSKYVDDDVYNEEWKYAGYVHWLDQILQLYRNKSELSLDEGGGLKKLHICVPSLLPKSLNARAYTTDVITQWLSFAEQHNHNIEDLSYHTISYYVPACGRARDRDTFPNLITSFLVFNSLTRLKLEGCNLTFGRDGGDYDRMRISLPCLKQLYLCFITLDEKILEKLLSNCISLEKLEYVSCRGVKELRLPRLPNLKDVRVNSSCEPIRVHLDTSLPDLQHLRLAMVLNKHRHKCQISVAPNSCKHLVELYIDTSNIVDEFINNVAGFAHQLKRLHLVNCPKLKRIKIPSNALTDVCIDQCPNLRQLELYTHNLFKFRYSVSPCPNIRPLLLSCPVPHDFSTYFHIGDSFRTTIPWHAKLVALLANFSQSKTVRFTISSRQNVDNNMIIPQELRESLCPPLWGVQHLVLRVPRRLKNRDILQNLDNLLWLSPHTERISLADVRSRSELSLELLYEDERSSSESCGCYPSQPMKCWRHSLKGFSILSLKGLGDSASMRKLLEMSLSHSKACLEADHVVPRE